MSSRTFLISLIDEKQKTKNSIQLQGNEMDSLIEFLNKNRHSTHSIINITRR